ncbi:Ig-like V-type domain-containing protein FAM187A [Xenopus laevis]|uniref:Ig-like domain-containing protein n=2 Tax=Xenopus laevis TaxID=8355 RepID=A0A974BWS8_XENLA|nr:Ig-like V-type domain-containing protein FAM187A [Xenopus laevis]OCT62216.1 hypothetical protein XELAEV_18043300mg [Xenopus laevis]
MYQLFIIFIYIFIRITFLTSALEADTRLDELDCPAILMYEQIAFVQDSDIELPCRCKTDGTASVIWFYKRHLKSKHITLFKDSTKTKVMVDSAKDKNQKDLYARFDVIDYDLVIVHAKPDDSGIYICGSKTGEFYYGYELDIQSTGDRVIFIENDETPLPDVKTDGFQAYTSSEQWSKCDRCGVRGEQRKIGLCYASSPYIDPRFQIKGDEVSCGSDAIPERFKSLIANRPAEIFIRSCKVDCHNISGTVGKVVNFVSNVVKGVGSFLTDKLSFLQKHVLPTQNHVYTLGSKVILTCPGAKPNDAVAWDKGRERLYRSEYLIGTRKYMNHFIDHGNKLQMKFVEFTDRGFYTCWLNGKKVANFQLDVVTEPTSHRQLTDEESIFAMKFIGFSFLVFTVILVMIHFIKCWCYYCRCCPPEYSTESKV